VRYNLYSVLEENDGITIFDPCEDRIASFLLSNGYHRHILSKTDILKPYMISYAYYGVTDYTDLILLLNNIDDISFLYPGAEIYVPTLQNIKEFLSNNIK
jgi:hypothetical protein